VYGIFPRLAERRKQLGGTLSGGEQQMLAVGRALMSRARMLLLDEPSMGLAPVLVAEIFRVWRNLTGTAPLCWGRAERAHGAARSASRFVLENAESCCPALARNCCTIPGPVRLPRRVNSCSCSSSSFRGPAPLGPIGRA
jgi:branched-chain amino acid transport system ATP-binding protein